MIVWIFEGVTEAFKHLTFKILNLRITWTAIGNSFQYSSLSRNFANGLRDGLKANGLKVEPFSCLKWVLKAITKPLSKTYWLYLVEPVQIDWEPGISLFKSNVLILEPRLLHFFLALNNVVLFFFYVNNVFVCKETL